VHVHALTSGENRVITKHQLHVPDSLCMCCAGHGAPPSHSYSVQGLAGDFSRSRPHPAMDAFPGESLRHRRAHAVDNSCAKTGDPPNTAPPADAGAERPSNPVATAAVRAAQARLGFTSSADAALAATSSTGSSSETAAMHGGGILKRRRALEAPEQAVKAFNLHLVQVRTNLVKRNEEKMRHQCWIQYRSL
jgi:hypothetical protein